MKLIILIFSILVTISVFSQVNKDSVLAIFNDSKQSDSIRYQAISDLCWDGYMYSEPDSAIYWAKVHLDFAKKKNNKAKMGDAINTIGVAYYYMASYDTAAAYFIKSQIKYKEAGSKKGMASSLNNLGNVYIDKGDYSNAIEALTSSLLLREEIGDSSGMSAAISNIGIVYMDQNKIQEAITYFEKSLLIDSLIGDEYAMTYSYNNLGNLYAQLAQYEISNQYFFRCLKACLKFDDLYNAAAIYHNLSVNYTHRKHLDSALILEGKSIEIREEYGDLKGLSSCFSNIGDIYSIQGQDKRAAEYYEKSLIYAKQIDEVVQQKIAYEGLYSIYKKMGNYKQALLYHEQFIIMKDSVISEENKEAILKQSFEYDYQKKVATDSLEQVAKDKTQQALLAEEKAQNEKHKAVANQRAQQIIFLIVGLICISIFGAIIFQRFKLTKKQKVIIEDQKKIVVQAFDSLEEKNKEIMDSIKYAKRIQSAILPPQKIIKSFLEDSFVLYKPKDIVAGDFYWMETKGDLIHFAVADCTGHGVPGALVSVICNNGLNRSVREHGLSDPGQILDKTREIVIQEFEKSEEEVKDGMDISLCTLNLKTYDLKWAGANNPLWIIKSATGELVTVKADKQPIGKYGDMDPFTTHDIKLEQGDCIYLFSDGYQDQFGGPKGKKFMAGQMQKLFLSIKDKEMSAQKTIIDEAFENWKFEEEQIDDVCVIGVRV